MTRNNLDEHLSWLLHAKPSIPGNIGVFPPVREDIVPLERQTRRVSLGDEADTGGAPNTRPAERPSLDSSTSAAIRQGAVSEMARLRTAPGSSSKTGLACMGSRSQQVTPSLPPNGSRTGRPDLGSHKRPEITTNASLLRNEASDTSYGDDAFFDDVEMVDLTERHDEPANPTPSRLPAPRTSRKRKSEEYEADIPRQRERVAFDTAAVPQDQTAPRASAGFATIEEFEEPPADPPPPYSTIEHSRGLQSGINSPDDGSPATTSSSTMSSEPVRNVMPDSEDDSAEDMLTSTKLGSRRESRSGGDPPSKRRLLSRNKPTLPPETSPTRRKLEAVGHADAAVGNVGHTNKPSTAAAAPSQTSKGNVSDTQRRLLTQATQDQQRNDLTSDENDSLKALLACPDDRMTSLLKELDVKRESISDAAARLMDDEKDADHLIAEADALGEKIDTIAVLLEKVKEHHVLSGEKARLFQAMRDAVKDVKDKDRRAAARAENTAGKKRLDQCEAECIALLQQCMDELAPILKETQQTGVAVRSTQAFPTDRKTLDGVVPSSSRIAQTQYSRPAQLALEVRDTFANNDTQPQPKMSPNRPRITNPTNIATYFSPPRNANRDNTYTHPNLFDYEPIRERHKTVAPRRPQDTTHQTVQGCEDDEDEFGMNDDLFSNRMGTPPQMFGGEDDDFGCGYDDNEMLELAQDLENEGAPGRSYERSVSRTVFAETSGNSQGKKRQPSANKVRKTPAKSDRGLVEELMRYSWSDDVKRTLKDRFRLRGFRENQLQAINATLAGKDTFVLMPTGGGKSLCYQLPALITSGKTRGVTIVISPLLSLMEDQVQHLKDLSIQAFLINGETAREERSFILDALKERNVENFVQLLYVTPEMLTKSQAIIGAFDSLYQRQRLARIVIDEAHCVSQWGHDFRPDYKQIGEVRQRFPGVPAIALTATATENVKVDVIHNLGIRGCEVYTQSFNRRNLYYEVRAKGKAKEDLDDIAKLIKDKYSRQTGIIYCLSRKKCEEMADSLQKQYRIKAHHYHAGMDAPEKSRVQQQWQAGGYHVIVATIAFGMGIDKANVRFVIHHSIPKSLEGYYQETGRAGRDQKKSGCYLYYGYQDAGVLRRMIDEGDGSWEQKERQHLMLRKMIQYCENRSDCRRVQVLAYFNEAFNRERCEGQCDNCNSTSTFETIDFTKLASTAVRLVQRFAPKTTTLIQCLDIFRGATTKKIKDLGQHHLDEFGVGSDLDRGDVERLFSRLLIEDAIREENHMNRAGFANQYVTLGRNYDQFLRARVPLQMQVRVTPKAKSKEPAPKRKKIKKAEKEEQSKHWKQTVGSMPPPANYPMSTNVSSPIQAASRRKKAGRSEDLHPNGYKRDTFVVSDPEDNNFDGSDDDDDDAFEPVRIAGRPRRERTRELGPPITTDERMERLNEMHRIVVDDFLERGKKECERIRSSRNLREVPFTDSMLREMAINFSSSEEEMLLIPNIDPDKIGLYAKNFLRMIRDLRRSYEEMMQHQEEERLNDPNAQNVIDLVSDDEDEYGSSIDSSDLEDDEEEEDTGEPSAYFQPHQPDERVAEFNARFAQSQSAAMRTAPKEKTVKWKSKKGSFKRRRGSSRPSDRASAGTRGGFGNGYQATSGATSRVAKSKATGRRANSGAGGSHRGAAQRGGGISMMPT